MLKYLEMLKPYIPTIVKFLVKRLKKKADAVDIRPEWRTEEPLSELSRSVRKELGKEPSEF